MFDKRTAEIREEKTDFLPQIILDRKDNMKRMDLTGRVKSKWV